MATTALEFLLEANKKPMGGLLAAAGTADANEGPDIVKYLMIESGIDPKSPELQHAGKIYSAVKDFIINAGFIPDLPRPKYWIDKPVSI